MNINLAICAAGEIWGGVEQCIYTFCREIKRLDVKFTVILFNEGLLYDKLKAHDISVEVIRSRWKYDWSAIFKIKNILMERNINIMHVHGYKATILGGIAARLYGVKLVKTEHGMLEPSHGIGYLKMFLNLWLDRAISKYFLDAVVFVSNDIKDCLSSHYSGIQQHVIYNGIAPIQGVQKVESAEFDRGYFNVGVVGRLTEVKGHIYLLQAIKKLEHIENLRLYIFGEGPLSEFLKEYCREACINDRVFFTGFQQDIYAHMANLNLLVIPSLHEGHPYILLEAMFMKVPVVASDVGGLREMIKSYVDGILVPPKDDESLASAIEKLYNEPTLSLSLAQHAYTKVNPRFLASNMVVQYIDFYKSILQMT